MKRSACTALATLFVVAIPCIASSGSTPFSVPIRYEADLDCPDSERFMAQVRVGAPHARPAEPGDKFPMLVVAYVKNKAAVARLIRTQPDGSVVSRDVTSSSCEGVVSAIALTAAMMIEDESAKAEAAASASAPGSAPGSTSDSAVVSTCAPLPSAKPLPPPQPLPPARSGWALGAHAKLIGGMAPGLLIGSEHYLEPPAASDWPFRRIVRASFLYAAGTNSMGSDVAHTRLLAGSLVACPLGGSPMKGLTLAGCAEATLGAINVRGEASHPISTTKFWSDISAGAVVQWELVPGFDIELLGGAIFPVTRYTFEFRSPDSQFYSVPWIGATGGAGLHVALP